MVSTIIDTVYLVAYLRSRDPLHRQAMEILENLDSETKVSQASLIELDLLMKSRGFTDSERAKTWSILEKIIPIECIEIVTPRDLALAAMLVERYSMDYFDALIAAQCINRNARPLTTDSKIIEVVNALSSSRRA